MMQRKRTRWLGKDLLLAVLGIATISAAQAFESPLETAFFLNVGLSSVPATMLDVGIAALVSCLLLGAGNRIEWLLERKSAAVIAAVVFVIGLVLQILAESAMALSVTLISAGCTILLFCWLVAVCSHVNIGVVELMIEVEILITLAALLPDYLSDAWCMVLAAACVIVSAGSFCLFPGKNQPCERTSPSFKADMASLGKVLCSFFIIGLVVGALQYAVFVRQESNELFPIIINVLSLVLVLWLFTRGRDFSLSTWTKVVATLSLAALVLVLFSVELTYLSYVLAGVAYSLLECGALYIALLLGRLYPDMRIRILGTAWCVVTLGSVPLMASAFFGISVASRLSVLLMALLLVIAAVWILDDRNMALFMLSKNNGEAVPLAGRSLERFYEQQGLTSRERDVFNLYIVGRSAPYIAEKLVISESTVKSHLQHIYTKCDVHSRQELISLVEASQND